MLFWIIRHWSTNSYSFLWSCDQGIQDTSCLPIFLPAANRHIFCICTSLVHQHNIMCIIILFESVHNCTQAIHTHTHKPEYEAGDSTRSKSCATEFKCIAVVYLSTSNVPSPLSRVCMSKSQAPQFLAIQQFFHLHRKQLTLFLERIDENAYGQQENWYKGKHCKI